MPVHDRAVEQVIRDTTARARAAILELIPSAASAIKVYAPNMVPTSGTPVARKFNAALAWGLGGAATAGVSLAPVIPSGWTTLHIDALFVANASGFSGDVVWQATAGYFPNSSGGTSTTYTATHTMATNAAQVATTRIATGVSSPAAWWGGNNPALTIERLGADAADTYSQDVNLLAIIVTKAS